MASRSGPQSAREAAICPLDRVNRENRVSRAPRSDALWVSDFTYVATWTGIIDVAFVIDAYAWHIAADARPWVAKNGPESHEVANSVGPSIWSI